MTRSEHLAWCKARAHEYINAGKLEDAFASMASDLGKHPETRSSQEICAMLGTQLLISGNLARPDQMRSWIDGFN